MNSDNLLADTFSWRGTIGRREYFQRLTMATLIFMAGLLLQFCYEPAFTQALGLTGESAWHPVFFIPLLVEFVCVFGNPMTLPAFIVTAIFTPASVPGGGDHPGLCLLLFAAATLLMLVSGLWSLALTMRRLRDAGASAKRLAKFFAVFIPLSFLMSFEELPFAALLLLPFLIWIIVWLIVQWRAVLRPTRTPQP